MHHEKTALFPSSWIVSSKKYRQKLRPGEEASPDPTLRLSPMRLVTVSPHPSTSLTRHIQEEPRSQLVARRSEWAQPMKSCKSDQMQVSLANPFQATPRGKHPSPTGSKRVFDMPRVVGDRVSTMTSFSAATVAFSAKPREHAVCHSWPCVILGLPFRSRVADG